MYFIANSYLVLYWTGFISLILIIGLTSIAYYLSPKIYILDRVTSYECGFQPFHIGNLPLEIHFFLIGLTFLIFDMEVIFLYPWFQVAYFTGFTGLLSFIYFFLILILGFLIEYFNGLFYWNKNHK
jgi:NADH:ubiquinone oxidoreductase subunit 3 (subunit A)